MMMLLSSGMSSKFVLMKVLMDMMVMCVRRMVWVVIGEESNKLKLVCLKKRLMVWFMVVFSMRNLKNV